MHKQHRTRKRIVGLGILLTTVVLHTPWVRPADPNDSSRDGFRWSPSISFSSGDHRFDLNVESRYRSESWNARTSSMTTFAGIRNRLGLKYSWKDRVTALVQGQQAFVGGLSAGSSGPGGLYRANTKDGDGNNANGFALQQGWLEYKPIEGLSLRGGRQGINLGTTLKYKERDWTYVKFQRESQRLIGTVAWSTAARSYDGGTTALDMKGYLLYGFAAQPTTGVFDIRGGYKPQNHVVFGGMDFTVKRGTWVHNTEFRSFFIGYLDTRDPDEVAGLFGPIRTYTLGGSVLGIYPLGPGKLDVLVWVAGQWGSYVGSTPSGVRDLDHAAWALLAEVGYQFALPFEPWLRTGVNVASGDGNPDDGKHNTFFNLLPTNHLYYGSLDQLAFQNLINWFAQFKFSPIPKVAVNFFVHRFWLMSDRDSVYSGTGAFNRSTLGFAAASSNGSGTVGTEIDVTATYQFNEHVGFTGGYSYMFGGPVYQTSSNRDTKWVFAEMLLKY